MSTTHLKYRYRCYNDCLPQGCPTHEASLTVQSVSDSISFDDGKGSTIALHPPELEALFQLLREANVEVSGPAASRDWEKLNPIQRAGLQAFRDHMASELTSEAETFHSLYPELRLTWNFTSDALFRATAESIPPEPGKNMGNG